MGQSVLVEIRSEHVGQPVRSMVCGGRYATAAAHVDISATQGSAARAKGEVIIRWKHRQTQTVAGWSLIDDIGSKALAHIHQPAALAKRPVGAGWRWHGEVELAAKPVGDCGATLREHVERHVVVEGGQRLLKYRR